MLFPPTRELFLCISASAAVPVHPNSMKKILDDSLSTFFIKCKPVFSNGPRRLLRNPPNR